MVIKMENKTYIVYMHRCPNDKKYIGVTRVKTYSRFHGGSGYRYNKEFYSDIKKYGWGNIEHIIIGKNIDKEQAYKLEQELIKKYNTTNFKYGYNKQNGGEKGKMTQDIKEKISKSRIGKKLSEETKEKLRIKKLGSKNPMYNKKPANCRKVIQYDLNNNIVKIWNDIHEVENILKIHHANIIKCCKGERKTTGGYKWCYYEK